MVCGLHVPESRGVWWEAACQPPSEVSQPLAHDLEAGMVCGPQVLESRGAWWEAACPPPSEVTSQPMAHLSGEAARNEVFLS
mmetsp:Transcript_10729/g.29861  ORF Transcript_10729/g.29861 Transcript_10729/m.29861 type:complete len:82 (+) Transcript_10729:886-1131(+)